MEIKYTGTIYDSRSLHFWWFYEIVLTPSRPGPGKSDRPSNVRLAKINSDPLSRSKKCHLGFTLLGHGRVCGRGATFSGGSDFKSIVWRAQLVVFQSVGHFFWCHRPEKHNGAINFAASATYPPEYSTWVFFFTYLTISQPENSNLSNLHSSTQSRSRCRTGFT